MAGVVTFDDIAIANMALTAMGEDQVTSFTGDSLVQRVLRTHYEHCKQDLLTHTAWRFATKKVALSKLTSDPPGRWSAAWQLPSDYLHVLFVYPGDRYEIQGQELWSNNTSEVMLDYIQNTQEGDLMPAFITYLYTELVVRMVKAITGDDPSTGPGGQIAARDKAKTIALFLNASAQPNQESLPAPFIDVRH